MRSASDQVKGVRGNHISSSTFKWGLYQQQAERIWRISACCVGCRKDCVLDLGVAFVSKL